MSEHDELSLSGHSFEDSSLFSEGHTLEGNSRYGDGETEVDGDDISHGEVDDALGVLSLSYEAQNDQSEIPSKIYDLSGRGNSPLIELSTANTTLCHQKCDDTNGKQEDEDIGYEVIYDLSGGSSNTQKDKNMTKAEESAISNDDDEKESVASNVARFISHHPRSIIISTVIFSILMSALVVFVGKFQVEEENKKGVCTRTTRLVVIYLIQQTNKNIRVVLHSHSFNCSYPIIICRVEGSWYSA